MHAFLPDSALTVARLLALLAVEFITGFGLQVMKPSRAIQLRAWILAVAATLIVHWITLASPPGFRMLGLIAALFLGMKAVVAANVRAEGGAILPFPRWLAFTAGWPGMRPGIFAARPKPRKDSLKLAVNGFLCAAAGTALMLAAGPVWRQTYSSFAVIILFFIGSSLLVHYGLFALTAAFWRRRGFDCGPLFLNPLPSENLGEFWGRRWNLPFHEMTAVAVYRPLTKMLPPGAMLFLSFAFSGLLHEVAISLPVQAGFGLPLGYFLLHGSLVGLERFAAKRGFKFGGGWGRVWTFFWLIAPLPVLFHGPFLRGVVWPLIGVNP